MFFELVFVGYVCGSLENFCGLFLKILFNLNIVCDEFEILFGRFNLMFFDLYIIGGFKIFCDLFLFVLFILYDCGGLK